MRFLIIIGGGAIIAGCLPAPAAAQSGSLQTLYSFSGGADGGQPAGQLVPGKGLTFFGTTEIGGAASAGTVFEIRVGGKNGAKLTTLYSFAGGRDGAQPTNMIADWQGNLYGVTSAGGGSTNCGSAGCGTIFELSPSQGGGWTEKVLYAFQGSPDGYIPNSVGMDAAGNLFGFALGGAGECRFEGGYLQCGTAFELSPPSPGSQTWSFTLIYTFTSDADGAAPFGPPVFGKNGTLIGAAAVGGHGHPADCGPQVGCGFIFKLVPPANGQTSWSRKIIYQFQGPDGNGGFDPVVADPDGNLYGMTNEGGPSNPLCPENRKTGVPAGCGVAFELTPPAAGGSWIYHKIWDFQYGADGAYPYNSPLTLADGAVFGTSSGPNGAVVEFLPPQQGQTAWTEKTLFAFSNDANGSQPEAGLTARGAFYGTTAGLGQAGSWGTVFRIAP
jgi:hypothetical protein